MMASGSASPRKTMVIVAGLALTVGVGSARADDLLTRLQAIGRKALRPLPPWQPLQGATCAKVDKRERAALGKRALAWIDDHYPDERPFADGSSSVVIGCKDPSGFVALAMQQDREEKRGGGRKGRHAILRAFADRLEIVEERTSVATEDVMEWANEGSLALLGQVDVDRDGALDLVTADVEHEGGASESYYQITVRYAAGAAADIAQVTDLADVAMVKDQLVVGARHGGHVLYGCIEADRRIRPCAAAARLQAAADRREIAERYASITAADLPDRERLSAELATLGVKLPKALVATARETTPVEHAGREVARLVAAKDWKHPLDEVVAQPHLEAIAYTDDLAAKLGDQPCTTTPVSAAETATATDWVHKQDPGSAPAIEPAACGPYVWVAWTPRNDPRQREVLLTRDGKRLLGFTSELWAPDAGPAPPFFHSEGFFAHGDQIVGVVIAPGSGPGAGDNLWVISAGKVVAQSKGAVRLYAFDDRWEDRSHDIFVDGDVLWHATPTGRDKVPPELVHDHETMRAALNRLSSEPPSHEPGYLAALATLGADPALIAACKALP